MDSSVPSSFEKMPQTLPIYEAFTKRLPRELRPAQVKVQKPQTTFSNRHQFAFIWHPSKRFRGGKSAYMVATFGASHRIEDSRIETATEPYSNYQTHHVIVRSMDEIDDRLMGWIRKAYEFALAKQGNSQSGETKD